MTTHGTIGGLRDDPVILLGMHHSGTSIFAEVLHRHGVFMQADMHHHESKVFTRDIDDRMIMGGGAGWTRDPILPVDDVMAYLDEVRTEVEGKALKKYVRAGYDGESRWGFKDPRACVTLPLFLQVFPNAQLLHIVRDEADVAESLASRPKEGVGLIEDRALWRSLHRQHVERAREYGRRHGDYFEFAYEDFCRRPLEVTSAAFAHIDVPVTPELESFLKERIYTHRIGIAETESAETQGS